ncbi:hypothetical protein LTR70_000409 [Exophiala xenobiotica]|uniref:Arrestin C-terminal-like domain-containing protein n=1 Tax=Lithohypha guttulata TaxID=1690604 RepID=A0ABR0KPU1_9EURO|nr:hypothetical protein LTR24_000110 [Lithohypha guttulata]KAK5330579.1 hypothetical protein LTR70_000409 [Exophiala xenobiotica]
MLASQEAEKGPELFWRTKPGIASIPFSINLPLNLGPPPYTSKHACIRYVLLPTVVLQSGESRSVVSQRHSIQMLTVFDPYKALASLPNPLVATETLDLPDMPGPQSVKLTAGLHRQTWVSGNSIFVDLHIINRSWRTLRKLELQLQRSTVWYEHAAAGTGDKNANHLRLPKKQENDTIKTAVVKKGTKDWTGTPPDTTEIRTCHIQVPQGHVTVSTGRFFEIRYFLNVVVTVTVFKSVTVQLPITLIHMNSLDIMPNALVQVAASIEAKRARTLPQDPQHVLYQPYHQGEAFVAPQKRSLQQARRNNGPTASAALEELKQELDRSPRKHKLHHHSHKALGSDLTGIAAGSTMEATGHHHGKNSLEADCYHCHLSNVEHEGRPATAQSQDGPKLPRLQVSTSGLGFTETEFSDFSVRDPTPKKVMLSEQERRMVSQQRELQRRKEYNELQRREPSARQRQRQSSQRRSDTPPPVNPSALLGDQIRRADPHVLEKRASGRRRRKTVDLPLRPVADPNIQRQPSSARKRANTRPDLYKGPLIPPEQFYQGVAFPDPPGVKRITSKKRGKMPADLFGARKEKPPSRSQSRHEVAPRLERTNTDYLMR